MELNKRKSLLTPAAPTVWGMIHGDINNQQDIVDRISEKVDEATGEELTNRVIGEVNVVLNERLGEVVEITQPRLESGVNIKTMKGRSILGEGDIDPLDEGDRMLLETIETKADRASTYTKREVNDLLANVEVDTSGLATKEELQSLRDTEVQRALMKSDTAQNVALAAEDKIKDLRTYVDEQIGGIDTITDDILA
jgi:hypothetical protein